MEYTKLGMNKKSYTEYVENKSPKSSLLRDILVAFVIGGLICMLGQAITDFAVNMGIDKKTASTISSISLIFIGAFLTAFKLYQPLGKFAGAGSIVPITGFSNSIVSPAIEYRSEGLILGIGANMFKVAGPVLVYGIGSSVILGLIYYLVNLFI